MYRCEVFSVEGFVQQLAVCYFVNGYWFYVTGRIPAGKDPKAVDAKLIAKYAIDISKWERARRKRQGMANLQYLRFGRFFVILATHGHHAFFEEEGAVFRDGRRTPVRCNGYAISYRGGHPHVRIDQLEYNRLKEYFLERCVHVSADNLAEELGRIPFEAYAPIRRQLLNIFRAINRRRKTAGLPLVPTRCLRLRRRPCRPFDALSKTTSPALNPDEAAQPQEEALPGQPLPASPQFPASAWSLKR